MLLLSARIATAILPPPSTNHSFLAFLIVAGPPLNAPDVLEVAEGKTSPFRSVSDFYGHVRKPERTPCMASISHPLPFSPVLTARAFALFYQNF